MKPQFVFLIGLFLISVNALSQHMAMSITEVKTKVDIHDIQKHYKSAVSINPAEAVFKEEVLQPAYTKLLQDLGAFLSKNNFKWEKKTKCFQRIYFSNDGAIDYFIFNFLGKAEDQPSEEKQTQFSKLVNLFIKDYKFSLSAKVKFAQCSPTYYMP